MKKVDILSFSTRKTYRIIVIFFMLICLIMGFFCFRYYRELCTTIRTESSEYLQEISSQIGKNVSRTINDNFSVLGTISSVLKSSKVNSFDQLQSIVLDQQSNWNYKNIMLIDNNGWAYNAYGDKESLGNDDFLQEAILNRERSMAASKIVNGSECIVFVIPMDDIVIDGTNMCALAATYDLTTFDQILSLSAFDGKAYANIIRRDGSVVVRSSSRYAAKTGYNLLSTMATAEEIEAGNSLTQIKNDIMAGFSGFASYTLEGVHKYLVYTPLETKEWCLLTIVPVKEVSGKSELFLRITFMLCGIITLVFALLFTFLMVTFYRHKQKLEQIAYVDPITHGNTIQKFYEEAGDLLKSYSKLQYALIYTNIEKFKVLNEQFGRRSCDEMLCSIGKGITKDLSNQECVGRLSADNFCILVEYKNNEELVTRMDQWYQNASQSVIDESSWLSPILEFGVYVISNDTMEFSSMIDRAKLALRENTGQLHGRLRYAIYDDLARQKLFREKHLEDMMVDSLKNCEFQVYLQPKYCADTETVGGAEALVRWVSKSEGMIYPDEFISLFEKNGFITSMDLYVFEKVCGTIRSWLDAGLEPIKISVNCSRVHLKNPHFLDYYLEITERYGVPARYLEIELTENVVFEDVSRLSSMINEIHAAGFGCSMDDFGSGYSSLNLIKDIPVDTIKLDKIFFQSTSHDLARMESVIGSILMMSRSLQMKTVAEGVEEREQVDMLSRLGCDYIQGYFFAKPMPIPDFEKLAFGVQLERQTAIDEETK